jgi:membrane-associated protein
MDLIQQLFNVSHLLSTYGYIGIFVIVFLESGIFFMLPGDSLLFTAGLLATGVGLNIKYLLPLIFVATFLGGIAGYYIGVYLETLYRFPIVRKIIKKEYLAYTHEFFEKHGKITILMSRFIPIVRTFAPIVAGIAGMNKRKFILYTFASSVLWTCSMTLLGYFLGRAFPQIKDYLHYFLVGIVVVSILPGLIGWIRERKRKQLRLPAETN